MHKEHIYLLNKTNKTKDKKMKAYILLSTKPGTSLEVVKRLREKVKETVLPTQYLADMMQS